MSVTVPIMHAPHTAQKGAVLLFSLIVLLLLTVIGVAAMQTTILQERMAGGQRDRQLALQGAEAAIREAERMLNAAVLPAFEGQGGRYHRQTAPLPFEYTNNRIDWNATMNSASRMTYEGGTWDGLLFAAPDYVIEQLPPSAQMGGTLGADESMGDDEVFRVTARATGGSGQSVVIVQTIFRR
jgi:type IV pilus assembly protein PilX